MSDSVEMRRLILHAADRLAEEEPLPSFERLMREIPGISDEAERRKHVRQLCSLLTAMTLAESTLRMVAACMAVEPGPDEAGGASG